VETLEQEVNQLHSELCAGLADPKRLLILYALSQGALNVSEIAEKLKLPQPTPSRHLKLLRERNVVIAARDGACRSRRPSNFTGESGTKRQRQPG
jgi:ArsR family transcriptional regulator